MHKWEGRVQTQLLYCGRLSTHTLGFRVRCRVVLVLSLAQISSTLLSPPPRPPRHHYHHCHHHHHHNVLAKLYIASPCCVILNQWALILLLKHCGFYWKKEKKKKKKKKAHDFQGCLFFKGEEGGWGNGGTLPLPFSLLWKKNIKENVCNWNTKLWLLMLFFFSS